MARVQGSRLRGLGKGSRVRDVGVWGKFRVQGCSGTLVGI